MKAIRLFIIRFLAKRTLRYTTEDDVLRIVTRSVYIGESKLSDEEIGILKEEALALSNSMLWKFTRRNIEYLASMKIGKQAQSRDDIFVGQAMFYNLEIIQQFLDRMKSL